MTKDDIMRMAREAGLHSAVLLRIYDDREAALCDSEIAELRKIERFAKQVVANIDPKSFISWQEGYEAGVVAAREKCAALAEKTDGTAGANYLIAKNIRAGGTT